MRWLKIKSIGAIEFKSIGKGIEVSNDILKKNSVEVLYLKSICPGRFLIIITGEVSQVNDAIEYGVEIASGYMIDSFVINNIDNRIIDGLKHKYLKPDTINSVAVVETNKVCAGIKMLDKTLKSSDVSLIMLQLSFTIGGKLVYMVAGDVSSLEYGIRESKNTVKEKDIIYTSIIPSVDDKLLKSLIK